MVRNVKRLALAGAFLMVAAPAFAQVPPQVNPLGVDLDPLHLFTPAQAPAPAPEAEPRMHRPMHHRMMRHRMMSHHMMSHHMMKKPMMKKSMMKEDAK